VVSNTVDPAIDDDFLVDVYFRNLTAGHRSLGKTQLSLLIAYKL